MKSILLIASLILGANIYAANIESQLLSDSQNSPVLQEQAQQATEMVQAAIKALTQSPLANWKVGDTSDYNMNGGIISGKMHMAVRELVAEGFWTQTDMDLGFVGKQKVEILYDKNTGAVLQLLVNGQKQTPPSAADQEVIDSKQTTVTVPKGTFPALYAKIKNKKNGEITEVWINMEAIPVGGLIKTIAPSQLGQITVELTNFHKQ
jgi:hypothetical protein